jgi:hypothetical protein
MKKYLVGFFYSLPVQLLLLHFRRYQVLLIFWYILFATITGHFLQPYGANSLFLAPEYLTRVDALSMTIVGFSVGVFVMSWNIATFILHTRHIKFLATTAQPFLKFCINNAVIPLIFLGVYFGSALEYNLNLELVSTLDLVILFSGFSGGFILCIGISFAYFFSADKNIYRTMGHVIISENRRYEKVTRRKQIARQKGDIRVDWFLSASLELRKPRNVQHYSQEFLDSIFKRHHIFAVVAVLISFLFLLLIGFFSDINTFQIPSAASITIFFGILIGVATAISLYLGSWSIPSLIVCALLLDWLYQENIIDPRNKAYGINYNNEKERPAYNRNTLMEMVSPQNIEADKKTFLKMLQNWKRRQASDKPVLFIINSSGGGTRSATFTLNVLQTLDSVTNGQLMKHTFLINGASGGLLGSAYFRELYAEKLKDTSINLQDETYSKNISRDLLNPLFSSLVSRDIIGPVRKVEINGNLYIRDRGYAFEQKLNYNTRGILNKTIGDYKHAEESATVPVMFFNSVITRDGREMIVSTHPVRFLMQPLIDSIHITSTEPDAIDFNSFFQKQDPLKLNVLSALRMNATFPYVLPNVWLPTNPVIDVMDAGLRDNFGQQTSLRFIMNFKDWLQQNVSKVVLIQIRDRPVGDWERPYEPGSVFSPFTKPIFLLQNNWYRLQDYFQIDELNYVARTFGDQFYKISFQYIPAKANANAALSFHLTASEKIDIEAAMNDSLNMKSFQRVVDLMK